MNPVFTVFGLPYFCGGRESALRWLLANKPRISRYVCVANAHTAVTGWWDGELRAAQAGAGMNVPDGRPLVWAAWLKAHYAARQVRGSDLIRRGADLGRAHKTVHYYFGGAPGMARDASGKLKKMFPGMKVGGAESPPFRPLSEKEISGLARRLKKAKAGLLWVALGAPKQEKWMARHCRRFLCTCVGIGGALPFFAGVQREAPAILRRLGLEWAFRLAQEPGRLWKRYLLTNPLFLLGFFLEYFGLAFPGPSIPGNLAKRAAFLLFVAWPLMGWGRPWLPVLALILAHLGHGIDRLLENMKGR